MTIKSDTYTDIWRNCLITMQDKISFQDFNRWLKPLVPLEFDGKVLKIRVPSQEYIMHIENNYMSMLRQSIEENFGKAIILRYAVPQQNRPSAAVAAAHAPKQELGQNSNLKNPFANPNVRKISVEPQLNFDYTFENFIEGDCNRLARMTSLSVAANPGNTPFNPLFIYGESGLGKTHIAQAIGIEVKKQAPHMNVLYVSANKFQAQYQNASLKGDVNDFVLFYQMIDVLIIDDIQEFAAKPGTQNIFFNIFNHLHLSKKQIILTADRPPVELKDIMERLITRFKWSLSVELTTPDYNTKVKIIESQCRKNQFVMDNDVVEFLATNIKANFREIEGALSLFIAHTKFLNEKPTIELARKILVPYVKVEKREITSESIINLVLKTYALTKDALFSKSRTNDVAKARQIAMYLCKQHTSLSFKAIGSEIGGKNHATVLYACKQVAALCESDKKYKEEIDSLSAKL